MIEDARSDLIDALADEQRPIPVDDARDIAGDNKIVAESVINQHAQTDTYDGEEYVVSVEGGPTYTVNDLTDADDSAEAAESAESAEEDEQDPDTSDDSETAQATAQAGSWEETGDRDLYEVNGLRIDVDPAEMLVGQPTGEEFERVPKLTNGHDRIPNEPSSYMAIPIGGGRTSKEAIGRVMGEMNRPLLLEGEAGSGKNLAIDVFEFETNRPKYRINFGTDTSVFDLVGEKDLIDGESYYILGKLAKPAMFGGTVIFDEVNMVSGDVSSFVHGVTEEPGSRSLELRGAGITLTDLPVSQDEIERYGSWYDAAREKWDPEQHVGRYIHPEFRVTATANPLGYADTKSMNAAFRDRFVVLEHPYLTQTSESEGPSTDALNTPTNPQKGIQREAALLTEETGVPEETALALVDTVAVLREAREQNSAISCPVTHRTLLKTVEFAGPNEEFMPFRDAFEIVLTGHASTPQDRQYISDTIADEL